MVPWIVPVVVVVEAAVTPGEEKAQEVEEAVAVGRAGAVDEATVVVAARAPACHQKAASTGRSSACRHNLCCRTHTLMELAQSSSCSRSLRGRKSRTGLGVYCMLASSPRRDGPSASLRGARREASATLRDYCAKNERYHCYLVRGRV